MIHKESRHNSTPAQRCIRVHFFLKSVVNTITRRSQLVAKWNDFHRTTHVALS